MRIGIITEQLGLGGTQRKIIDIVGFLVADQRVEKVILILGKRKRFNFLDQLPENKVEVVIKNDFCWGRKISFNSFIFHQLVKNRINFVLSFYDYCSIPVLLARKIVFWRCFRVIVCEDALTTRYTKYHKNPVQWWLIKKLYPTADWIIATSTAISDELCKVFDVPKKKIKYIPNWTNFEVNCEPTEKKYDCIFAGRFEDQKNVGFLIDVFAGVVKQLPKAKLLLIGEGEKKESVKKKASQLGLDKNIIFKDSSHQIKEIIQQSKLMLFSSRYEGMPVVALEAMSLGVPIISVNFPGVRDFIEEGKNGFIVKNKQQFIKKTKTCLCNQKLYENLSSWSKDIVKQRFSIKHAKEYCKLLLSKR